MRKKTVKVLAVFLALIALTVALIFISIASRYELFTVEGDSMLPSIKDGETVVVEKADPNSPSCKRGDIVLIRLTSSSDVYIKRVIGLEGDRIRIKYGKVYLNGEVLQEDYIKEETIRDMEEIVIGDGCVFVLGDNRKDSYDSRDFGAVPAEALVGRVRWKVLPSGLRETVL